MRVHFLLAEKRQVCDQIARCLLCSEKLVVENCETQQGCIGANLLDYIPLMNFQHCLRLRPNSSQDVKDVFYDQLSKKTQTVPKEDQLLIFGDINARVGADHDSWLTCLGRHGIGKLNDSDQRLLELYVLCELCITNTYFQAKAQNKVSRRHTSSKHWRQLDLILTRRRYLRNVLTTRSFQSTDYVTNHSLAQTPTKEDASRQTSGQTAYQCHHDPKLNEIHQVFEGQSLCKLT